MEDHLLLRIRGRLNAGPSHHTALTDLTLGDVVVLLTAVSDAKMLLDEVDRLRREAAQRANDELKEEL